MEKDNQSTQEINSQAQNPLGIAPVGGLIAKFAIPAIISMLVSAMYNIVDQIFIGQGVGMLGNAATNVAFPVTTVATALALLLGIGGASNYNLEMGAGQEKKASGIAGTALSSLAISGLILAVIVLMFLKTLLTLFGATVIGQVASGVLVIVYFCKFRKMYLSGEMLKPKLSYLGAIISLGLASCINQIAMAIVQIVLNNILRYYGANSVYGSDIPIACVGVISKVNQVFMAICIGISQGSQPIWGFNYGAKKYDRVRQAYRYSVTACTVIATIFFFCFQIFPHQIVGIFGTGSELYFQFAERYLKIFMFMTFANGIQPVSSGFFTSIGMAKLGIVMSLTRQVIFLLPLIIIFPLFMGIDGVMYAGPIADAAAFVLAIVFARRELGKMRSAEIV